jgi:hypothetical protein
MTDTATEDDSDDGYSEQEALPSLGVQIPLNQFMRRATDVYELYSCASLFDYIHTTIVQPLEAHVNKKFLRPEIEGWLKKTHPNRIKCLPQKGENKR